MIFTGKPRGVKRALIYTRVSTEEQAIHGYSLGYQEELLKLQCQKDGVQLVEHFQDDGYSAKDFDHRPSPIYMSTFSLILRQLIMFM